MENFPGRYSPRFCRRDSQDEPIFFIESDESPDSPVVQPKNSPSRPSPLIISKGSPIYQLKTDKSNSFPNVSRNGIRNKHLDKKHLQEFQKFGEGAATLDNRTSSSGDPLMALLNHTPTTQELFTSTIGEDYRNIGKIINDLQKISHRIASKYDVEPDQDNLSLVPFSSVNADCGIYSLRGHSFTNVLSTGISGILRVFETHNQ